MPNLIANHQKKVFSARIKKAYSQLSQANNMAIAKYDSPSSWEYTKKSKISVMNKYIFSELKGIYTLDNASLDKKTNEYVADYIKKQGTGGYHSDCMEFASNIKYWGGFITTDGYLILPVCHVDGDFIQAYIPSSPTAYKSYTEVIIDVNGFQKPNMLGRDVYNFILVHSVSVNWKNDEQKKNYSSEISLSGKNTSVYGVLNSGLYPSGYGTTSNYNCTSVTKKGCTAKLMEDGWEFKDDYPW